VTQTAYHFDSFPELETERLRLREITADDASDWLAVWDHPDVMRYLVDFDQQATDLGEVRGIIDWTRGIFANRTGLRWAITLKPEPTLIGTCGFHLYSPVNRCAEIGYELHHEYWRRGIMAEALAEILRFGFEALNLHRIEANVTRGNDASAGLLRRLGFTQEGTWRDKVYARGQFHDLWQFGLLEDEYRRG
jgi:[ribosomal protein S5]-alanine N-acetyltransferase